MEKVQYSNFFKTQSIKGISVTVLANGASWVGTASIPEGYVLVGCSFEFTVPVPNVNCSAPVHLASGEWGCRLVNTSMESVAVTGITNFHYVRRTE